MGARGGAAEETETASAAWRVGKRKSSVGLYTIIHRSRLREAGGGNDNACLAAIDDVYYCDLLQSGISSPGPGPGPAHMQPIGPEVRHAAICSPGTKQTIHMRINKRYSDRLGLPKSIKKRSYPVCSRQGLCLWPCQASHGGRGHGRLLGLCEGESRMEMRVISRKLR